MKVKMNGKWSKHRKPAPSVMHGYRCENVRLNRHDLRELARLPDKELCARVRQISARANRHPFEPQPYQKSILETLMGDKGFHSGGFVSTPTGRHDDFKSFFLGTREQRTGRWSSEAPMPSMKPRPFEPVYKSPMVDIDFSEIEKRVMAQMGTDPSKLGKQGRFYTAEVQARQEGKAAKLALEAYRKVSQNIMAVWVHHAAEMIVKRAVEEAVKELQTRIDEEGCGAAFAALRKQE